MLETVYRFFCSIALFRRDGVADPQIDDRSGDDVLDAAIKAIHIFNDCSTEELRLSMERGSVENAAYFDGKCKGLQGAIAVLQTLKANQEQTNPATPKDGVTGIA